MFKKHLNISKDNVSATGKVNRKDKVELLYLKDIIML